MQRRVRGLRIGSLTLGLVLTLACGGSEGQDGRPVAATLTASDAMQLFQNENCTMCHGELTQGVDGVGPALRDLAPFWNRQRLTVYLADPDGFRQANPEFENRRNEEYGIEMPASDHLSREQRQLLADWLLTR
jgi:cytochrome c551/c552